MICPFLIGETIYLTAPVEEDSEKYREWISDPEVRRFLTIRYPIGPEQEREIIRNFNKDTQSNIVLAIRLRSDDRLIGNTALHRINSLDRVAEFGLLIGDKTQWGRGIGAEAARMMLDYAFNTLNLNRVFLHTGADHSRARRCYEKAGFKLEGTLRENRFREGKYRDDVLMSALKDEWMASGNMGGNSK